jgi:hypothetical protein
LALQRFLSNGTSVKQQGREVVAEVTSFSNQRGNWLCVGKYETANKIKDLFNCGSSEVW